MRKVGRKETIASSNWKNELPLRLSWSKLTNTGYVSVGDIPGPRNVYRSEGRSMSRDELSSVGRSTSPLGGNKKTLSRSISVLAPWRPKFRQDASINYDSGFYYNQ